MTRVRLVQLSVEQVAAGDLLVCAPADVTSWRLDALIRRAATAGASGVVLPDGPPGPTAASRTLADRLRLPLLAVPAEELLDAVGRMLTLVSHPEVEESARLLRCAHRWRGGERDPEGVVEDLETELGGQARIGDRGQVSQWTVGLRADLRLAQTFTGEDGKVVVAYPIATPGVQWLVIELDDPPTALVDQASALARLAVLHLRGWFLARRWELERDHGQQKLLLADLIAERGHLTAATRRRTAEMGWRLDGWYVGICLTTSGEEATGGRDRVATALRAADVPSVVVETGAGWMGWVTTDEAPPPDSLHRLLTRLRGCVHALGADRPLRIGVGNARGGPQGLARSLEEAREIARGIDARTGGVASTDALGIHRLVGGLLGSPTARVFAESALAPIADDAALLDTLTAYLDCGGSVTATARRLGVHRNTVNGRLGRTQRSLAADLADPDVRLAFQLACRALNVKEGGPA